MITVREVDNKRDLRRFVDFPNKLYKDVEQYIPAMYGEELEDFDKCKNPAFEYCVAKCFLAYNNSGEIVGRIAGILNENANKKWERRRMRFSHLDFIDDEEVSAALFKAVEAYAREKNCEQVHGPLGFCDLDREGMLVEGFEQRSMFITYYNHPYYMRHMERLGYAKDTDWVEYLLTVPEEPNDKLSRLADIVMRKNKLHIADIRKKRLIKPYVRGVFELLNKAYENLYGVVPLSPRQVEKYTNKFLPIVNYRYVCIVLDQNEEVVAFGVAAPSIGPALKKSGGRLFPLGAVRVLKALRKNDTLDLFLVAVKPELQGAGLNAIVMDYVVKNAIKYGIRRAETGPELETNDKVQAQWRFFETQRHKRRRCYIKSI